MKNIDTISANIRRLRSAGSLTMSAVAEGAGLSLAAYRKIEGGVSVPRVSTLQSLAEALGVGIQELVAPVHELKAVRFRSLKKLRNRGQILADVGRWLEDFNTLEGLLGDRVPYALREIVARDRKSKDLPDRTTARIREAIDLGEDEPIRDICGLLEARGIKVRGVPVASPHFFGLSVAPSDGGPAIVVNTWDRISVERWIFTAAHELGHLVLHLADYDVGKTDESEEHEVEANAFASAFLMPHRVFDKEWAETSGLAFVDRVLKIKRMFLVSYRTVLYRLSQQGDRGVWMRFQADHRRRYGKTLLRDDEPNALAGDAFRASFPEGLASQEPEHLLKIDFTVDRLQRLVRVGVERGVISLSRGGEILRCPPEDMRELASSWAG